MNGRVQYSSFPLAKKWWLFLVLTLGYSCRNSASTGTSSASHRDTLADGSSSSSSSSSSSALLLIEEEKPQYTVSDRAMKDVLQSNDDGFDGNHHHQQQQQQDQQPAPTTTTATTPFCQGMYMTMFMDGFHWSMFLRRPPAPQCLNYFVQSWRLDNASQFQGAMLFTFLLAILVEGLSSARSVLVRRSNIPNNTRAAYQHQHALLTAIYALQTLLGYILMLVTMSFSVELFLSVVVGLMVGNLLFIRYNSSTTNTGNNNHNSDSSSRNNANTSRADQTGIDNDDDDDDNLESRPLLGSASENTIANLRRRG